MPTYIELSVKLVWQYDRKQTLHVITGKPNVHIINLILTFLCFHFIQCQKVWSQSRCMYHLGLRKICLPEPLHRGPKLWMFQPPSPHLLIITRRNSGNFFFFFVKAVMKFVYHHFKIICLDCTFDSNFFLFKILTVIEDRILARTETHLTVLFHPHRLRAWLAWRLVGTQTFLS